MKKILQCIIVSVLFLGCFANVGVAHAQTIEQTNVQLTRERQNELGEVLLSNISRFKNDNGDYQLKIINNDVLKSELDSINAPISVDELEYALNQFNYYVVSENDNGVISDMNNDVSSVLKNQRKLITCANVMGAIGLIHAGSYSAAAYLLGITGPAALVIPFIISTAYYLGSLLC